MTTRHTVFTRLRTALLTLPLGAALVVPGLFPGSAANAAEAPQTDTESATETASDNPQPTTDSNSPGPLSGSKARRANDKGGVFLPSEDISEDIAVSFPVDI